MADDSSVSSVSGQISLSISSDGATISAVDHQKYVAQNYILKNELVTECQRNA